MKSNAKTGRREFLKRSAGIASAVLAGHRYAREMDTPAVDVPFRRDDSVIVD